MTFRLVLIVSKDSRAFYIFPLYTHDDDDDDVFSSVMCFACSHVLARFFYFHSNGDCSAYGSLLLVIIIITQTQLGAAVGSTTS